MEKRAIISYVGEWSDKVPSEEGLYLFIREEQESPDYPFVDLVELTFQFGQLIADSDYWITYFPIEMVGKGKWSKKIKFEN